MRDFFWDLRCDSLLPESIPGCKSVEIAQKFPPPAGSFSETSKKEIKISRYFKALNTLIIYLFFISNPLVRNNIIFDEATQVPREHLNFD